MPDDADLAMHEDYVEWYYWSRVLEQTQSTLDALVVISPAPEPAWWDNAPHHAELANFPHHKHVGQHTSRQPSDETCLEEVMQVIISQLPPLDIR